MREVVPSRFKARIRKEFVLYREIVVLFVNIVVLRNTPTKSVRFNNEVGLTRDTNGRFIRGDRPPRLLLLVS